MLKFFIIFYLWLCASVVLAAEGTNSIWEGIYSDAQAERGAQVYADRCASCHAVDLRGNSNSPSLLGMSFMFLWEGRSVGELFTKIRTEMPSEQPGSLSAQNYLDALAFILRANQFPAGTQELEVDPALNSVMITPRPQVP